MSDKLAPERPLAQVLFNSPSFWRDMYADVADANLRLRQAHQDIIASMWEDCGYGEYEAHCIYCKAKYGIEHQDWCPYIKSLAALDGEA